MNATSASRAEPVLVWDAPVRVFHWLMVLCFVLAWLSAESERWRMVHVTLGYTMAGLLVFRLLWGAVGTHHARFVNFVRGPLAVGAYLGSLVRGASAHHVGHNPAGAWAILGLLGLTAGVAASGWAVFDGPGGERWAELHEAIAHALLLLVLVHLGGVLVGSWLHGENLVRAMITGRKLAPAAAGVRSARRGVALVLLVAVLGFWWVQWRSAPPPPSGAEAHTIAHAHPAG